MRWRAGLLAAALGALASPEGAGSANSCTHPPRPPALLQARVVRVVDGDTLRARLRDGQQRVRLVGVDAPETLSGPHQERQARQWGLSPEELQRWGEVASAFARRHLSGRWVGLELDIEERDEFGRLLAYVWLGRLVFNLELVREGYAWAHPVPPNLRYADRLGACPWEAQRLRRGLWGR